MPFRTRKQLEIRSIENDMKQPPSLWAVPIAVDTRIVCLVVVETPKGKSPEAIEFGKSYAANRINAAIHHLNWPNQEEWKKLRYLSFVEPVVDLMLYYDSSGKWHWLNLLGTVEGQAMELSPQEVKNLLSSLIK
jgi:hypothetical protein